MCLRERKINESKKTDLCVSPCKGLFFYENIFNKKIVRSIASQFDISKESCRIWIERSCRNILYYDSRQVP